MNSLVGLLRGFSIRLRMLGAVSMVLAMFALVGTVGMVGALRLQALNDDFTAAAIAGSEAAAGQLASADAAKVGAPVATLQAIAAAARRSRDDFAQTLHGVTLVFEAALGFVVLVVAPLTLANSRSITRPISDAAELADAIAAGDLTRPIRIDGRDEAAALLAALERMQASLRKVVGQVHDSSLSIERSGAEVASGNGELSSRTEQAANALQQTASSMEQLTGTVRQSADSAQQASQLATSAAAVARRGGSVVAQVVSTMDEIHASSKRIGDIIGVIDGIAFQTNILALNAAVEAARAGEQGRGFAVVASEVRSLAQRSASAAREIKALIGASVDRVEAGSRLVAGAGSTMDEIVAGVQRVSDIIGEISAAAVEQSSDIGQVTGAVGDLDRMTQQNAALVEQSAAAAESLREQSRQLATVIAIFRTGSETGSAAAAGRVIAQAGDGAATRPATKAAARAPAPEKAPTTSPRPAREPVAPAAPAAVGAELGHDGDWETF